MNQRSPIAWRKCAVGLLVLLLSGCEHYQPRPLPTAADLAKAPDLTVSSTQFSLPGLAPHPVPSQGLDATTVMVLAVVNNPDLKAARLQARVARAQLLQAGLLPDPQFSVSPAFSALNYGGGIELSEVIQALITRGAAKAAATANEKQINLNILWQEWQVAAQAQQLFIQTRADGRIQHVLNTSHALLEDRYLRDRSAMLRGDATSVTVAADLNALADADTSLRQLQTELNLSRHELNALLGLQPDVCLHLVGPTKIPTLTQSQFNAALASLPRQRADLLAIQAGYHSLEENLRRAVLAQFPAISAGVNLERDPVEGVNDYGPAVTLTLPVFNRNRGQIAVERATRAVLWETYQARLDAAASQADEIWKSAQIMSAQLKDLDAQVPRLERAATAAEQSFHQDNLNAGIYISAQSNFLAKQVDAIRLRASLEIAQSAMHVLLGIPFDASSRASQGTT
jgi:outer membrane protein, heavy metal efflux system